MALAEKELKKRAKELLEHAQKVCAAVDSWPHAHNAIYGIGGKAGQLFTTVEDRKAFRKLPENQAIRELLNGVRGDSPFEDDSESTKFLLRLPKSVYAALAREAEHEQTSINQLLLTKVSISLGSTLASVG